MKSLGCDVIFVLFVQVKWRFVPLEFISPSANDLCASGRTGLALHQPCGWEEKKCLIPLHFLLCCSLGSNFTLQNKGVLEYWPVQKGIAKGVEFPERFFGIHHQRISRNNSFHISLHNCYKGVSCRLWSNPHPWEILLQQVPVSQKTGCGHETWAA